MQPSAKQREILDIDPPVQTIHPDVSSQKGGFHQLIGNEISPSAVLAGAKLTEEVTARSCSFPGPAVTTVEVHEVQPKQPKSWIY